MILIVLPIALLFVSIWIIFYSISISQILLTVAFLCSSIVKCSNPKALPQIIMPVPILNHIISLLLPTLTMLLPILPLPNLDAAIF